MATADTAEAASSPQFEAINSAIKTLQRKQLLTLLGHPHPHEAPIGDINDLSPITNAVDVRIEARDAPFGG